MFSMPGIIIPEGTIPGGIAPGGITTPGGIVTPGLAPGWELFAFLAFSISSAVGPIESDCKSAKDFHWPLIRTLTFCRSGVGDCSSTVTLV
jgi:hypothetical protein